MENLSQKRLFILLLMKSELPVKSMNCFHLLQLLNMVFMRVINTIAKVINLLLLTMDDNEFYGFWSQPRYITRRSDENFHVNDLAIKHWEIVIIYLIVTTKSQENPALVKQKLKRNLELLAIIIIRVGHRISDLGRIQFNLARSVGQLVRDTRASSRRVYSGSL